MEDSESRASVEGRVFEETGAPLTKQLKILDELP